MVVVGGAGDELLGAEVEQEAGLQGDVRLDGGGCGKGPAGAALPLVLDGGDHTGVPPVDGVREVGHLNSGLVQTRHGQPLRL